MSLAFYPLYMFLVIKSSCVYGLQLFGLASASVGVWSVVDKVYVADVIGDDLFSASSYMVIVAGIILLAISVFGLFAVRKERRLIVIVVSEVW